jgi:phosphoribosylformimino-5-aminoimidazole carboxamide ribotide isomerase
MLLMPAIDLRGGRCVRLRQGDFDAETRYDYEPCDLLRNYGALGAPWLHVVDLDAARDGTVINNSLVLALAGASATKLQVGGGVHTAQRIEDMLAAGIGRVVVGSAAIDTPLAVGSWLRRFGSERMCLAFDVRVEPNGVPRVHTSGWRHKSALDLWNALEPFTALGLQHVLCTDIERDGMRAGPNLDLYREATARWPHLAWQASGGVRDAADLRALAATGVASAVSGTALLEERIKPEEFRAFLPNASSPASTSATAR